MLVRLTSSAAGEMVMFAHDARALFEIIGKECTARGVFTREQVPGALLRLRGLVDEEKLASRLGRMQAEALRDDEDDDHQHDGVPVLRESVSLMRRAQPMIRFMELTEQENGFILWEAESDF